MNIELNDQQAEWLKTELEIMIEESDGKDFKTFMLPRSQFSRNVMRSLLSKLKEEDNDA
jgi:hypothetical protein